MRKGRSDRGNTRQNLLDDNFLLTLWLAGSLPLLSRLPPDRLGFPLSCGGNWQKPKAQTQKGLKERVQQLVVGRFSSQMQIHGPQRWLPKKGKPTK